MSDMYERDCEWSQRLIGHAIIGWAMVFGFTGEGPAAVAAIICAFGGLGAGYFVEAYMAPMGARMFFRVLSMGLTIAAIVGAILTRL